MRKTDSKIGGLTQVKLTLLGGSQPLADDNVRSSPSDIIPTVTERRRKWRRWPALDDDEESDGGRGDEVPLAGSRMRAGPGTVEGRRWSAAVSASRRSLMTDEDDGGRQHRILVRRKSNSHYYDCMLLILSFSSLSLIVSCYGATLSTNTSAPTPWS